MSFAGSGTNAAASSSDLRHDAWILRAALALHPGLHRYLSPQDAESRLARFEHSFVQAGTLRARALLLSQVLSEIKCGHTWMNPSNQSTIIESTLYDLPTRLPFEFRWLGSEMMVTRAYDEVPALEPGTLVKRVNGQATAELLTSFMRYVRSDGHNDNKRRSLLSVQGRVAVESFDVLQSLLAPPKGGRHVLDVESPQGAALRVEIPAVSQAERQRQRHATSGKSPILAQPRAGRSAAVGMHANSTRLHAPVR